MEFEDENSKFRKLYGWKCEKNEQSGDYDLTVDVTCEPMHGYSKENNVKDYPTELLSPNLHETTIQSQSNNNTSDNNFYLNVQQSIYAPAPASPFLLTFPTNAYNQENIHYL